MSKRLDYEQIDKLLNKVDSYDQQAQRDGRRDIRSTIQDAYREADEAGLLRDALHEQAREVVSLQIQVERWEERYRQQPEKFAEDTKLCDTQFSFFCTSCGSVVFYDRDYVGTLHCNYCGKEQTND